MTQTLTDSPSPFHEGEQEMQRRAGRRDRVEAMGRRMIRPYMPDQHREFYAQLPFLVAGALDAGGWPWASLLCGAPGFASSSDGRHLRIRLHNSLDDPLRAALHPGATLGLLGIELHSRRRNRVNGRVVQMDDAALTLRADQSFGNCPQYIRTHELRPHQWPEPAPAPQMFHDLPPQQAALIARSDMFFVSSHAPAQNAAQRDDTDVSHRGGKPGFVRVQGNQLTIPDFAGNNMFNTLGNFLLYPRAGLLFPDFASGSLLLLTGTVSLLPPDAPEIAGFDGAQRGWQFTLHRGLWRKGCLPFVTTAGEASPSVAATGSWTPPR